MSDIPLLPPLTHDHTAEAFQKALRAVLKSLLKSSLRTFCERLHVRIGRMPPEAIVALADEALASYNNNLASPALSDGYARGLLNLLGAVLSIGSWLNENAIEQGAWRPGVFRNLPTDKRTAKAVHELWIRVQVARTHIPLNLRSTPGPKYDFLLEALSRVTQVPRGGGETGTRNPPHPCLRAYNRLRPALPALQALGPNFQKHYAALQLMLEDLKKAMPAEDRPSDPEEKSAPA